MGLEALAYPFLFIAIFFEVFVLLTFLSAPAKAARARRASANTPSVALIIPCHNEAATVARTTDSALALDYPKSRLQIILVDDGSTDDTARIMARYAEIPQIRIIRKENGGKHTALNAGIATTDADIIGCLDADSVVDSDALREIISCFDRDDVAAATAAMSVHQPNKLVEYMQYMEYFFGIALRHTLSSVNALYVTPGPFSLYRHSVIKKLGGFRYGYQTEDMEMALRIQRAGYHIENAPRARVYTKVPGTIRALLRQRTRWITGFMRNVRYDYHDLVFSRRHEALGMIILPLSLFAIFSGIMLFLISLTLIARRIITYYILHRDIPMVWHFTSPTFDWFYMPASLYILLIVVMISVTLAMIGVGKYISKTPGPFARGMVPYVLLYGFIAPFWLMRATADVVLNRTRTWK